MFLLQMYNTYKMNQSQKYEQFKCVFVSDFQFSEDVHEVQPLLSFLPQLCVRGGALVGTEN